VEREIAMRQMIPEDWECVRSTYLEGLATGDASFETEAPSWEKWDESHLSVSRLVAVSPSEDGVVGWAARRGSPREQFTVGSPRLVSMWQTTSGLRGLERLS